MRNIKGISFGKIHIGRIALPVWAVGVAVVATVAAAGQAVGPVLSGQITGTTGLVVTQSALIARSDSLTTTATFISDAKDGVIVVSSDGSSFTAGVEAYRGQAAHINLDLVNTSSHPASALITLVYPSSVTVDAEEFPGYVGGTVGSNVIPAFPVESDGVQIAAMSKTTWLMVLPPGEGAGDPDLQISLISQPGQFTVQATITQIQ